MDLICKLKAVFKSLAVFKSFQIMGLKLANPAQSPDCDSGHH